MAVLELTGMVDTSGLNQEGDPADRQQLAGMAKRRLAILRHAEEITGNVALTCRYYGISRRVFYTWHRRYDTHGLCHGRWSAPAAGPRWPGC